MNRRKIEINKAKYEIWGSKPWILITLETGKIVVDEATTLAPDFLKNPQKYNALRRITASGAALPVLFTGDKGYAMADEIAFILNKKL